MGKWPSGHRKTEEPALVVGDQRRTYAELDQRTNRLAHHFLAKGLGQGDHIGIYAYNCPEWVESMFAAFKIRATPININYPWRVRWSRRSRLPAPPTMPRR